MSYHRFKNDITNTDYDIFPNAVPHYEKLQKVMAQKIYEHVKKSSTKEIRIADLWTWSWIWLQQVSTLLEKHWYSVHYDAIDNDENILNSLKKKVENKTITWNIDIYNADVFEFLQNNHNTYDVIFSWRLIHNFLQNQKSIVHQHIFNALRSWWLFINLDKIAADSQSIQSERLIRQLQQFEIFKSLWRNDLYEEWTEHYKQDEQADRLMKKTPLIKQLTKTWFTSVSITEREKLEAIVIWIKQ